MGGYYNYRNNEVFYEEVFNLVYTIKNQYHPVNKASLFTKYLKNEDYSNLFIWNIETKTMTNVFSEEAAGSERIVTFFFEQYFDENQQSIACNNHSFVVNNKRIAFRHPKNLLLIETYSETTEKKSLWTCNKLGQNLKKITSFAHEAEWHLDIGNSLIRLVQQYSKEVKIEEFPW